jgi:putative ABC transport system ATP-binding protein/lipoprotein-releasing system ATP-binding protein
MIQCQALSKSYNVAGQSIEAVRTVDLDVKRGEFFTVLGHSGSGKSTLLSMIGGLTRPSAGRVVFDGEDIWTHDDDYRADFRNRRIGFVFQFASLIPTLTALGNVALPHLFAPAGVTPASYDAASELLTRIGLADKLHAYPNELSGGQQRRVAIARGFVNNPEVVLADEPTGDLDESTEAEVLDLFLSMCRERRMTIVMVTHNRDICRQADRTIEMKSGCVI